MQNHVRKSNQIRIEEVIDFLGLSWFGHVTREVNMIMLKWFETTFLKMMKCE